MKMIKKLFIKLFFKEETLEERIARQQQEESLGIKII